MVFNPRGVGVPQITDNIFDYSKVLDDFNIVMDHIKEKYPSCDKYLIGFSLGASYGMQYLSHFKDRSPFKGMVSIGNPFDVYKAAESANSLKNIIYGQFLTSKLIERVEFNMDAIERRKHKDNIDFHYHKMKRTFTTFGFDKEFTFKFLKYQDSKLYYKLFSCLSDVKDIDIPTLVIHSKNDPISTLTNQYRPRSTRHSETKGKLHHHSDTEGRPC